jgi:transcriptional regulator with XRE-family HTH domain
MIFLNKLKQLRLERGLLQSDIAKVIKKSERIVGFYETGERDMNTETLSILADFFNVSIDYLLGKTNIRNLENEFKFAYHKEIEGLTEEEIKEALEFYKMVKNRKNKENK